MSSPRVHHQDPVAKVDKSNKEKDDSTEETRSYQLACGCGAVVIQFKVPPSSYRYVEQLSVICQCHDCLGFPKAVAEAAAKAKKTQAIGVLNQDASEHVHFYKSDVETIVQGQELIGFCRLHPDSSIVRFYSKCCGTPLGGQFDNLPGLFVYRKALQKEGSQINEWLPPTDVLFHALAPQDSPTPGDGELKVHGGMWSTLMSLWMGKFVVRALLGFVLRKNKGCGIPIDKDTIGAGVESIQLDE